MTEKVKLEFKIPEKKIVEYNGVNIEVSSYLTLAQQIGLMNKYVEEYFTGTETFIKNSNYSFLNAEYNLMNYIFQACTNIDVENLNAEIYADADFWQKITSAITNYYDFRNKLNFIVNEIKQQMALANSVGTVLSGLASRLSGILDKIGDISPEEMKKLQQESLGMMEELKKNPLMGGTTPSEKPEEKKE